MKTSNEQLTMNNEQLTVNNERKAINNYLLAVLDMEMSRRKSSLQSFIILLYSTEFIRFVSLRRSSQYSVSAHSLREILTLTINSFLLMEYWASVRFAPIDVPERNNCLARVNSCFSSHRYLYRLYILIANLRLFSSETFSISILNIQKITEEINEKAGKV